MNKRSNASDSTRNDRKRKESKRRPTKKRKKEHFRSDFENENKKRSSDKTRNETREPNGNHSRSREKKGKIEKKIVYVPNKQEKDAFDRSLKFKQGYDAYLDRITFGEELDLKAIEKATKDDLYFNDAEEMSDDEKEARFLDKEDMEKVVEKCKRTIESRRNIPAYAYGKEPEKKPKNDARASANEDDVVSMTVLIRKPEEEMRWAGARVDKKDCILMSMHVNPYVFLDEWLALSGRKLEKSRRGTVCAETTKEDFSSNFKGVGIYNNFVTSTTYLSLNSFFWKLENGRLENEIIGDLTSPSCSLSKSLESYANDVADKSSFKVDVSYDSKIYKETKKKFNSEEKEREYHVACTRFVKDLPLLDLKVNVYVYYKIRFKKRTIKPRNTFYFIKRLPG